MSIPDVDGTDEDVPIQDVQCFGLEQEPGEPELILGITDENDEDYRFRFSPEAEMVLLQKLQERAAQLRQVGPGDRRTR